MVYRMKSDEKSAVVELRQLIHGSRLRDLMAVYGTALERREALRFDLPLLPENLRSAVELLAIGDPMAEGRVRSLLSDDAIEAFLRMGILRLSNGSLSLDGLRLIYHFGIWSICENRNSTNITYYYGEDSLALGRLLVPARGKALDVCSGTGAQGLLCALTADSVDAVDKQPKVEKLFKVNSVLNDVEGKMTLHIGDGIEPVKGKKFDTICCNPPLLPVPDGVPYPFVLGFGPWW